MGRGVVAWLHVMPCEHRLERPLQAGFYSDAGCLAT